MIACLFVQILASSIDAELGKLQLKGALCGVVVRSAEGVVYEKNADIRMVPASNQKLLTVAYALHRLGANHRFRVDLWRDTKGAWVRTDGHPALTFAELANAKDKLNLKPGPIRVIAAYGTLKPPSWEWDDLPNKYAAMPSAFTVDRGSFELWATGGGAQLLPVGYGVRVVRKGGVESRIDYDPSKGIVTLYGPFPSGRKRLDTLAVPDSAKAACFVLGGTLATSKAVPNRKPDMTLVSKPLIEIAAECLQKSDNYFAENLLLSAALVEGPLGSKAYETASSRLTKFLEVEVGCEVGDVRPIDGSGLSRHNLVTPRALAKVLDYARAKWGSQWLDLLATSGRGTLENRLAGSTFQGKTGSLNSVVSLSGYLRGNSEKPHVIVLVFNNTIAPASEIRAIQDSIVRNIELYRDGTVFEAHDYCEGSHPDQNDFATCWHWDH